MCRRQDEIRKCSVYRKDALSTSTITVGVIPMEKEKGAVGLVLSGGNGLFCRSGVPVVQLRTSQSSHVYA